MRIYFTTDPGGSPRFCFSEDEPPREVNALRPRQLQPQVQAALPLGLLLEAGVWKGEGLGGVGVPALLCLQAVGHPAFRWG